MQQKTRGIVLSHVHYSESSLIVRIFTEELGVLAFIVNGARSTQKKQAGKMAFFQPLTLLELVVYYREQREVHRIAELSCEHPYHSLQTDPRKSGIGLMVSEFLYKTLNEAGPSPEIYTFCHQALRQLDSLQTGIGLFPLQFLAKISAVLGVSVVPGRQFYQELQHHQKHLLPHPARREAYARALDALVAAPWGHGPSLTHEERQALLEQLLGFLREHLPLSSELQTPHVLRRVWSE